MAEKMELEDRAACGGGGCEEEEEEKLLQGVSVLDFDVLCSTVAQGGKWRKLQDDVDDDDGADSGGVFRMWEGELLDFFDDRRVAIQSSCCPCYRFGRNMKRAGFGSCFLQGTVYLTLGIGVVMNLIAFIVTKRRCFLYLAACFIVSIAAYLGFYRTQMKKKFNIRGSVNFMDDCIYHLVCPCCTLSQESRTLEMNNVQDGTWHGRGDTICVGSYSEGSKAFFELHPPSVSIKCPEPCSMQKSTDVVITLDNDKL